MRKTDLRNAAWIWGIGCLLWILGFNPVWAEADSPSSGFGLFRVASQSPFQTLRMNIPPHDPSVLARGEWRIDLGQRFSNVWIEGAPRYFMDYEMSETSLRVGYGIARNANAEICLENRRIFGGVLDGFIVGFHDAFGLDQDGRSGAPYAHTNIHVFDEEGRTLYVRSNAGDLHQGLSMSLKYRLMEEGPIAPAMSGGMTVGIDLGNPEDMDRDAPLDAGISVAFSKRFAKWSGYFFGALTWYGSDRVQQVELKKTTASGLIGVQWRFRPDMALTFQYLIAEGSTENIKPFSDAVHEIVFGWQGRLRSGVLLEIGVIENLFSYGNSVDFGFLAGISIAL